MCCPFGGLGVRHGAGVRHARFGAFPEHQGPDDPTDVIALEDATADTRMDGTSMVERETKDAIAEEASSRDVFNISTELNEISQKIRTNLKDKFKSYGLNLRDFYVQSINILSNDPSFEKLKEADDPIFEKSE